jgi:hypothetical protein
VAGFMQWSYGLPGGTVVASPPAPAAEVAANLYRSASGIRRNRFQNNSDHGDWGWPFVVVRFQCGLCLQTSSRFGAVLATQVAACVGAFAWGW